MHGLSYRYKDNLSHAKSVAAKKGFALGLGQSVLWIVLYGAFALCFWYGVKLIMDGEPGFEAGSTLTVSMPRYCKVGNICGFFSLAIFTSC